MRAYSTRPNAVLERRKEVGLLIPQVDEATCTFCGKCAEVCQFHAIAVIGKKTLVFPELCHGCGSCTLVCPEGAIEARELEGFLKQFQHVISDPVERGRSVAGIVREPVAGDHVLAVEPGGVVQFP